MAMATQSWAGQITSFESDPISPELDGFNWSGNTLSAGSGMSSNGDGNNQAPSGDKVFSNPGLRTSAPFIINGVSSSHVNTFSTTFFDTSFILTGLGANGDAVDAGGLLIQNLTSGVFSITSSIDTTGGSVLLLGGTIADATLSGIAGSSTGSVVSATVTYTGGLIFDQLASNGFTTSGSSSWSLINIFKPLAINSGTNRMRNFTSESSGLFDADEAEAPPTIPAPAALPAGLLLLCAFGLLRRKMRVLGC